MKTNNKLILLANKVGITALDIGARHGVTNDLITIASAVDFYGFEPDPIECDKLNTFPSTPWRNLKFIPTALGDHDGEFDLNLYRQRGCSSGLKAREVVAELFSRGDYYIHEGVVTVPVKKLDDLVATSAIPSPAYMKIDVQGMENEVFKGGAIALSNSLVGIRTEINFFPMYDGLPLFSEIEQMLRPYGFVPMRFLEAHEWRRTTRKKLPFLGTHPMPYSQGQMIHGDVLFLLHPEYMPCDTEEHIIRLIRLALIAVCYDHLDHAEAIFRIPSVKRYCNDIFQVNPLACIYELSKDSAASYKGLGGFLRRVCMKYFQ